MVTFQALLDEGKCIQKRLDRISLSVSNKQATARKFHDLMLQGNVKAAIRYLSRKPSGSMLNLDDIISESGQTTRDLLKDKHPAATNPDANCLIDGEVVPVNNIIFDGLNANTIRNAALHTHGATGPSGLDAYAWRRMCSCFKSASNNLCAALASVGRRISTTSVNPEGLSAFIACRLIPLDQSESARFLEGSSPKPS